MKRIMKLMSLALAGILLLAGCGSDGETFATVNGQKIPQSKYDSQLSLYKEMMAVQYQIPQSIRNSLIQEEVMLQDLKKNGVELKDEDYQVEYDKVVQAYGGAANYSATLQTIGVTDDQMKESLHFETISRKHQEWYDANHAPSDKEIQDYFDANKQALITVDASHILVDTEDEAKKVKERLDNGENFEDVAKEVSKDTGSASQGGELGVQSPSAYDPSFSAGLMKLKEGEVSGPVPSQFGYHIIRLNKRNDSVDALKDDIVKKINAQNYQTYLQELIGAADVKVEGESSASESSATESSEASSASDTTSTENASSQASEATESKSSDAAASSADGE